MAKTFFAFLFVKHSKILPHLYETCPSVLTHLLCESDMIWVFSSSLPPSNALPPSPPPPFFNKWLARGREGHTARGGIRQS